ncbi:MAG: beta-lactamase domain protein [Gemmatimonadetes bacterium]|nr:beta-lactamase domain protein [Gemmatimonadota bacterium]
MKAWMLGSGSAGNAVLVECGETRVLVDCGFGTRTMAMRLKLAHVAPESISACIVTHEHSDHVKGVAQAAQKWGWSVFATHGTAACPELADAQVRTFAAGDSLVIGSMHVETRRIPHDASEPIGLVLESQRSGVRMGVAYDVGHVTDDVRALCRDLDLLVLESNHDDGMLRAGPYPWVVQQRIAGPLGHLSNREASALAADSLSPNLAHVVLAHLSERCNEPELAASRTRAALARARFRGAVTSASQSVVVGPFEPRTSRQRDAVQMALPF